MKQFNEKPSKVTREIVAKAAGVSTFTVSQALRNMPGVAPATRARVKAVAEAYGYQINPVASLLAGKTARGRGGVSPEKKLVVVALSQRRYNEALFLDVCSHMGIAGEMLDPSTFDSPELLFKVLWNRGVHGVLLVDATYPWNVSKSVKEELKKFSIIKMSRSLPEIPCHFVRHSAYEFLIQSLKQVLARGFRRMAVLMMETPAGEDDESRLGAFLAFRHLYVKKGVSCQRRVIKGNNPTQLDKGTLAWLDKVQPDVIVAYHWTMVYPLMAAGYRFPGPIGFAAVLVSGTSIPNTPLISGNDSRAEEMIQRALKMLQEMIVRGERGFAEHPLQHVVDPEWVEGETLGSAVDTCN
ncbi:LacI family DNA-binding transcriptional regulator [Kiritimatiellaeota bacterium B1221]|nr:LacI family DNA-binding transcriptional regulator [Kiritimatiellaeota bacterium B1221]